MAACAAEPATGWEGRRDELADSTCCFWVDVCCYGWTARSGDALRSLRCVLLRQPEKAMTRYLTAIAIITATFAIVHGDPIARTTHDAVNAHMEGF